MNLQSSEVMKCSRRGCDFKTTSNRGIENHIKTCARKRSRFESKSMTRIQEAVNGNALIPKRFGGSASHVPCDNIIPVPTTCIVDNDLSEEEGNDIADTDEDLIVTVEERNAGISVIDSRDQNQQITIEERQKKKKAEDMARVLAYISRKVSKNTAIELMQILKNESFDIQLFRDMFKKSSDCISFVDNLFQQEMNHQGFQKVRLTSSDSEFSCMLFLRDPVNVLREQLGLVSHESLALNPRTEVDRTGSQSFGHPMSANLGEKAVPSVIETIKKSTNGRVMWNISPEKESFVGLGQIYSDKTQTSLRANALTLYPVHLTLLNLREEDRRSFIISGRSVVGLLPTEYENKGTKPLSREIKMELLQKSISRTFQSLRNVAMEGFECQTADSNVLKCHFVLANYVCDLPEAWDILGVKGQNSSFPCHRCVVPKELLSIPSEYKLRSVRETKNCREEAKTFRTKAKELECLDKYSLSLHASSFLESFPFVHCSPYLDTYSIFTYECLHNIYLGISRLLKEICCQRLYDDALVTIEKDANGNYRHFPEIRTALINGMNDILTCIERDSPATAFKIDFSDAGKSVNFNGFFTKDGLKGMLEAKDHRAVDQVMPFLAMFLDVHCGETVSTSIFTKYAEITMLLFRRNMDPGWIARDIKDLKERIRKFKEEVKATYKDYQPSEMGTPKFHMLDHICYDIERMGGLQYGDASYFERAHISLKERFREGSKRKSSSTDEVVTNFQRNMVKMRNTEDPQVRVNGKKGARFNTFEDDVGSLVRGSHRFTVGELHSTYLYRRSERKGDSPTGIVNTAADCVVREFGFIATRMFLRLLQEKAKSQDSISQVSLSKVTSAFVTGGFVPTSKDVVRVNTSYGISSRQVQIKLSQRLVASGNFYGTGPRNDCALIESEVAPNGKGKILWVGKVLGLFHIREGHDIEQTAFVRYFDVVPASNEAMRILGCVNLRWSGEGQRAQWFDIVPVASLSGVVSVLTIDYPIRGLCAEKAENEKTFHINRFFTDSAEIKY